MIKASGFGRRPFLFARFDFTADSFCANISSVSIPLTLATVTMKQSWTNSTTLIKNPMNPTHRIYEMVSGNWMICWDIYR